MRQFIAIESSSGRVIYVTARDEESAYKVVARNLFNMTDPIDTGNVDIDLYPIYQEYAETAKYITE